ncbi:hypothetical protein ACQPXH_12430 [Nocardia sp. CA-135953]|uniref:hypothetical protein n=1 Tax=Nocardia sp. CA-135953 TaxID=3239978 RepID=UPI003D9726F1
MPKTWLAQQEQASAELCRVHLAMDELHLEFRASLRQGMNFEAAMKAWSAGIRVVIDHDVDPTLPWLPCGKLWD